MKSKFFVIYMLSLFISLSYAQGADDVKSRKNKVSDKTGVQSPAKKNTERKRSLKIEEKPLRKSLNNVNELSGSYNYFIEFAYANQLSKKFPIYHWAFGMRSVFLEDLHLSLNYDPYYTSSAGPMFYSYNFFILNLRLKYNIRDFYFLGGPALFVFPYKYDTDEEEKMGLIPTAGLAYCYSDIPYNLKIFAENLNYFFIDGYWIDFKAGIKWLFYENSMFILSFTFRMGLASLPGTDSGWRQSYAKIPALAFRYVW